MLILLSEKKKRRKTFQSFSSASAKDRITGTEAIFQLSERNRKKDSGAEDCIFFRNRRSFPLIFSLYTLTIKVNLSGEN